MGRRNRNTISSWLDLARLAEQLAGEERIFRGEPFSDNDERAALERFKNDALPYLEFKPPSDHDLECSTRAPQRSVFSVHPDPRVDFRLSEQVSTWTIPGKENRWRIKCILESCGINYASIYPDLSGLARHIYWRYQWGYESNTPACMAGARLSTYL